MKIVQFTKQLNNTELGKGGTHDTYVLIPADTNVDDIFDQYAIEFEDVSTKEKVKLRYTVGREKRIVGLGQYYRSKNLNAGDEIIFERRTTSSSDKFLIDVKRNYKKLVFRRVKNGFEILTPEYLSDAESLSNQPGNGFQISFLETIKKRNDSPEKTDIYLINVNNRNIFNDFSGKEIGTIDLVSDLSTAHKQYGYKKYILEE